MKRRRVDPFILICSLLALLTLLFVGCNLLIIAIRGIKSLPVHLFSAETVFAVRLSVCSACISTVLCFVLAIPTAYILTRESIPMRAVVELILELTMSLPYIVLGLSLLLLFSSSFGKSLKAAGFPVVFSRNGIILAQLAVNLPFAIKLSSTALREVDGKLEHVAGLLGASDGQRFFTILLPMSRNTLISSVILVWSRALGEFGATLMLVGVTRMKTETLPASIFLNVSVNDLDGALASAFLLLMISAVSLGIDSLLTRTNKRQRRYG